LGYTVPTKCTVTSQNTQTLHQQTTHDNNIITLTIKTSEENFTAVAAPPEKML